MKYTAVISVSDDDHTIGFMTREETVVVEAESISSVVGEAQVTVASRLLEEVKGENAVPWDHEDLWLRIYDRIPVVAIIEGEPTVILNDDIYE